MLYSYKALNVNGYIEEGVVDAGGKGEAAGIISSQGLRVVHLEEKRESAFESFKQKILHKPLGDKKIALFCRQIAILLDTEPLHRILSILEREGKETNYSRMIKDLREEVESGHPLNKALLKYKDSFGASTISLIKAGEESGELKEILERIANYKEKIADAKEKFQGALIYPILLMCVTFGLVILMFTFIIPSFASLFQSFNATLPLPTRIVIAMGDFISNNGFIILLSISISVLSFIYFMQYEGFRIRIDEFILKLPLWGDFARHSAWQKILVTMATLIRGGFRIDEALTMSAEVSNNLVFKRFLQTAGKNFEEGHSMTAAFRGFGDMPTAHFELIAAGEKSGRLEEVLLKGAELSEKEMGYILKRMESMIGPILTLIVGGIVLFFVLSVVLPIFSLTEVI